MNVIAITQRVEIIAGRGERRDALDQRWSRFLHACGLLPLPVPNDPAIAAAMVTTMKPRGVLLTGGNSLSAYGGDAPERDETEARLLALARDRHWPVIGVCRGMQVIQHHYGVTLSKIAGHANAEHPVLIAGHEEQRVNSFHDFGATTTVPHLDVVATAGDGVVESIRHVPDRVLGLMWHPERYERFRPDDMTMFREWFGLA